MIRTLSQLLVEDAPTLLPLHLAHPEIKIITPSSPDFSTFHYEYNTSNTVVPPAVILPSSINQLATIIKHCTSQSAPIPFTIRGGGHDAYGRNTLAGVAQLDLKLLKDITVSDPRPVSHDRIVTVSPGVTGIEMQRALNALGLAAPTGWIGTVGVVGWACGGGYGLANGKWGMGVDNIVGAKLITATGKVVDTDDDAELLWALRGAGLGNFGVISELRLKTYPKPKYLGGFLIFSLAEGEKVLGGFQRMNDEEGIPDNFSGELTMNTMPFGPTINFMFAWISDDDNVDAGWKYLEKLKALGIVLVNTVAETSILELHTLFHEDPTFNAIGSYTMNSIALPRLSLDVIKILMERPAPAGGASAILMHHAHGRASKYNPAAAWAHREDHYICTPCGYAKTDATPDELAVSRTWSNELVQTLRETGLGKEIGYWSLSRPEHCNAIKFFGEETVRRLRDLKRKYNPERMLPGALPVLE